MFSLSDGNSVEVGINCNEPAVVLGLNVLEGDAYR